MYFRIVTHSHIVCALVKVDESQLLCYDGNILLFLWLFYFSPDHIYFKDKIKGFTIIIPNNFINLFCFFWNIIFFIQSPKAQSIFIELEIETEYHKKKVTYLFWSFTASDLFLEMIWYPPWFMIRHSNRINYFAVAECWCCPSLFIAIVWIIQCPVFCVGCIVLCTSK